MNSDLKYEQRVILYLDFLGFHDILENRTIEQVIELYKIISEIFAINKEYEEVFPSKAISQFSDCLVVSYVHTKDKEAVLQLIENIQRTHIALIIKDVVIRGALTTGELYHEEFKLYKGNDSKTKIVFGKGINKAYNMESKTAIYPRTIVDKEVYDFINNSSFKEFINTYHKKDALRYILQDSDGYYYIDYINDPGYILGYKGIELYNYKAKLQYLIEKWINNEDESIRQKYKWIEEKLKISQLLS